MWLDGVICGYMGLYVGYPWLYGVICGYMRGYMWLYGVIKGYMWFYEVICGYMWLYVVIHSYIWFYPILSIFHCSILLYLIGRVISAHISLVDIFLFTAHARNNEIDWEGTGGRSLTARTGA